MESGEDLEAEAQSRENWGAGPWSDEPDSDEWVESGLRCLMRRGLLGVWCGYVLVPRGHPWHGQRPWDIAARVHGGVTCAREHVEPGLWLVGFDCGHAFDLQPGLVYLRKRLSERVPGYAAIVARLEAIPTRFRDTYRTHAYAKGQLRMLARQARQAAEKAAN